MVLGISGTTVTIETAEDGAHRLAGELFESGDTVEAENGNTYVLTLVAGAWSPVFQPRSMEITGIDLMAMSREDGPGYDVGGQELDENGSGDIMIDGDDFRVSRNGMGMFMAEQFDAKSEASITDRDASKAKFGGTLPDNEDTAYNEAGTKLTIDGADYSISDLFDDGEAVRKSDNIVAEQRKAIERALTRINALINVIKAANQDETGREGDFNQQFLDRWSDIDDALDNIFGDPDADETPNEDIDHLKDIPDELADIVTEVEKVLAALASLEAFEDAFGEGGLFENSRGDVQEEEIEVVFDAVRDISSVRLGRSENTRFGVYSVRRRGRVAKDSLSSAGDSADAADRFGAFAYSPHKTSSRADLPSGGEAYYRGETIAQDHSADFNVYTGVIEIAVRFRSRNVVGLISNLMGKDGPYMHDGEAVASIILPGAALQNNASWLSPHTGRNATIVYVLTLGRNVSSTATVSQFKGQLVGEGEDAGVAAIGAWRLGTTGANDIRGAFGAERAPDRPVEPPTTDDDGETSKAWIGDVNPVNDEGKITPFADIEVAAADLYADGEETVTGPNFTEAAKTAIEMLLGRLDAFIALDDLDPDAVDTEALEGRQAVWDDVKAELERVFGGEYDHNGDPNDQDQAVVILSDSEAEAGATPGELTSYPLNNAKDGSNDVAAKQELDDILAALGSLGAFKEATAEDGIFYGETTTAEDEDGLLDGKKAEDVFNRVRYTVDVRYGNTDYTRFGAWIRTGSGRAVDAPTHTAGETGQFAYSPMEQTKSTSDDLGYPSGVNVTYEGKTIARDTAPSDGPKFYEGDIQLQVSWDVVIGNSGVIAIVGNLVDADGALYEDTAGNDAGVVTIVVFDADGMNNTDDVLGFNDTSPAVRLRYGGFGVPERTGSGDISGKFVGESVDGPRGVIGSWSLGSNLSGVYGADIVP